MFKSITLAFALILVFNLSAQKYSTKTGSIKFYSHTKLEDIKAENRKVVSTLDGATGKLKFQLLMKGFDFPNQLMEDHFNESYAESEKYPKASFDGQINDFSKVDLTKNATYNVTFTGKLTMKDVTKDITGTATLVVKDGKVTATSTIKVKPKDYNFVIPATAAEKIAEELEVTIKMEYIKQ